MNTYNEKLEAAKSLLVGYFSHFTVTCPSNLLSEPSSTPKSPPPEILAGAVLHRFTELGALDEDGLSRLSHEDIAEAIATVATTSVKPKVLAKQIADLFRSTSTGRPMVSSRKAETMSDHELLQAYDPEDASNAVSNRLKEVSRGEPFLMFNDNGMVNVADSAFLLKEVRMGYPGRRVYKDQNVLRAGETVEKLVGENPVFAGEALRLDETCSRTLRSWKGVPLLTRQFVRFLITKGVVSPSETTVHNILDRVSLGTVADTAVCSSLAVNYQKYLPEFNEIRKVNNLPSLVTPIGKTNVVFSKTPISQGKKVL